MQPPATPQQETQELSWARQVPCSPPALPSDCCGTAFPGLPHSLSDYSRSSQDQSPPAAVPISLLTPQPRWKHRQEQSQLLPREGWGCEQGHDRNSHCRGDKAAMVPT